MEEQNDATLNDQSFGYANAASRQDSLIKCLSGVVSFQADPGGGPSEKGQPAASTGAPMSITAEEEAFTKRVAGAPRGRVRRGLLADPPPFTRTRRGVVVREGERDGKNQYAEVKAADLRAAYALYLLETDLNHYRHLYLENERKQQPEGHLKYFSAPSCKVVAPALWLEEPWTAVENLRRAAPDAGDTLSAELRNLPALRQRFAVARKQEINRVRTKPRPQAGEAGALGATGTAPTKRPAGSVPGKGTTAALKVAAEQKAQIDSSSSSTPTGKGESNMLKPLHVKTGIATKKISLPPKKV